MVLDIREQLSKARELLACAEQHEQAGCVDDARLLKAVAAWLDGAGTLPSPRPAKVRRAG